MNNRIGLAVAGVIAAIAIILVVIQSGNLSQAQGTISSIQSTGTAQQAAFVGQGTAAVATLSAASTQAADSANATATSQANTAATAQGKALNDAANQAATAQAEALAAAAKAASTLQAKALAAASQAAATAEAQALADAGNKAATAQASAVANAQHAAATQQAQAEATLEAQATSTLGAAMNAAATQQAQAEATLKAQATATLGGIVNAMGTAQADALNAAQSAAAIEQEKALATVEAQATATLGASIAQSREEVQATQTVLAGQIADLQAQVATAQAGQSSSGQPTSVSPTAEATSAANNVPSDWKRYVGKGVAIQLPNTYVGSELGSDPAALGKMLRALGPDFAAAATLFEQQPEILSFIAVDVGGKTGAPASVIILSVPMPVKFSLNTLLDATVGQLPQGSKVSEKSVVQVGEYEAGRMIVETKVGGIISTQLQYYIIQNDKLYLVGFTGTSDNFESQLPAFEQSMKTFEILSKPGI